MGSIVLRESYHFFFLPFSPRSLFAGRKRSSNCYSIQRFCVKLNRASKRWSYYMKKQLANRQKMSNVPYKRSVFLLYSRESWKMYAWVDRKGSTFRHEGDALAKDFQNHRRDFFVSRENLVSLAFTRKLIRRACVKIIDNLILLPRYLYLSITQIINN